MQSELMPILIPAIPAILIGIAAVLRELRKWFGRFK